MANYTATQNGNFESASTWGGSGYPSADGDTFTIPSGITVTVTSDNTSVSLGASTVAGTLYFARTGTPALRFGNATLTINGTLDIGTDSSKITGTAKLLWNTTTDNAYGLDIGNEATVTIVGDYNATTIATLANNSENTDDDADIVLSEPPTGWQVGTELLIRVKKTQSSSIHSDGVLYRTISSISGANITLNSAITIDSGVGSTWVGYVFNVSRNIQIGKYDATKATGNYNTLRPNIYLNNANFIGTYYVKNAAFWGIYALLGYASNVNNTNQINTIFTNCVFGCGEHVVYNKIKSLQLTDVIMFSNSYSLRNTHPIIINGYYEICCNNSIRDSSDLYITDGMQLCCARMYGYSVYNSVYRNVKFIANYASGNIVNGCKFIDCQFADNRAVVIAFVSKIDFINCSIGYDGTIEEENYNDLGTSSTPGIYATFVNCKRLSSFPKLGFTRQNLTHITRLFCERCNQTDSHYIWQLTGLVSRVSCDGVSDRPSVDPFGGNGYALEVSDLQPNIDTCVRLLVLKEDNFVIPLSGSSQTIAFKIQSTFATTSSDLILEVVYYDSSNNVQTVYSTNTVSARSSQSDWTQQLSVSLTGTRVISMQIYLMKYVSGGKIYVGIPCILT